MIWKQHKYHKRNIPEMQNHQLPLWHAQLFTKANKLIWKQKLLFVLCIFFFKWEKVELCSQRNRLQKAYLQKLLLGMFWNLDSHSLELLFSHCSTKKGTRLGHYVTQCSLQQQYIGVLGNLLKTGNYRPSASGGTKPVLQTVVGRENSSVTCSRWKDTEACLIC